MAQVEQAQVEGSGISGAEAKRNESMTQGREGLLIFLTLLAYGAAWVGSNLLLHFESITFPLLGLALLVVAWLSWRVRRDS